MTSSSSADQLAHATTGFAFLFSNSLSEARNVFSSPPHADSPFHLTGIGMCAFLEAALGLEQEKVEEAMRTLSLAETRSRKLAKSTGGSGKFAAGTEMEVLNADAVILLGITHALSESYMGYLQCMYSLNSAHSKFTKLYKTVFPNGLDGYRTPATTPATTPSLSPRPSNPSLKKQTSFFGRWLSTPSSSPVEQIVPEGPVDEMILSGTAFGFGLFNLVLSLLPKRVQNLVGFFGFKHDRELGLKALGVSAAFGPRHIHAVFAGLVLMAYHGTLLLMAGWQADEKHTLKQYEAILTRLEAEYPNATLLTFHRAKILRFSGSPQAAIEVLQRALKHESESPTSETPSPEPHRFIQADALLLFDLTWLLLSTRQFIPAGETLLKLIEINSWSRVTYLYITAGCFFSGGDLRKAEELIGEIPKWLGKRKVAGREVPSEGVVRKKLEFYKEKHHARGGEDPDKWISSVRISFVDEIGIFWCLQTRLTPPLAKAYIASWESLPSEELEPDEEALRALLLGITFRSAGEWDKSKENLRRAREFAPLIKVSGWIPGWATVEYAITLLHQASASSDATWDQVLKEVESTLDEVMEISSGGEVEMTSRLGGRVGMIRGEVGIWKGRMGLE